MKMHGYDFFFDQLLFPVGPSKLEIKHNGKNKTVDLINDGEINILKKEGLMDIKTEFLLPNVRYPFAKYLDGFHKADFYLDYLKMYRENKQPFSFIVSRWKSNGELINYFNMRCQLEDYTEKESTDEGYDVVVEVNLKQYEYYCTKLFTYDEKKGTATQWGTERWRPQNRNVNKTHIVQPGDTLWQLAISYYGMGGDYERIVKANNLTGDPRKVIKPGMKLYIP